MTTLGRLYLRRRGRMTRAQARALDTLYADYCVSADAEVDWATLFGRHAPLMIEIGFGMGHALLETAFAHPEWNCVGIDVYRPGIGAVLNGIRECGLENVRIVDGDARQSLQKQFGEATIERINVFFPDPWPKKKHHKRRLITSAFVALIASRLVPGGLLQLATDWEPYGREMLTVLEAEDSLRNAAGTGKFARRPPERPVTRFEARGQALGHPVWDLAFVRRTPL